MDTVEIQQPDTPSPTGGFIPKSPGEFDPKIHATGKDGKPSLTPGGSFRKKRTASPARKKSDIYDDLGMVIATSIEGLAVSLGGENWQYRNQPGFDERSAVSEAWSKYLRHKEISNIPPSVMLCIAMGGYAAPRIPKGTSKSVWGKIGNWNERRKQAKKAKKDE